MTIHPFLIDPLQASDASAAGEVLTSVNTPAVRADEAPCSYYPPSYVPAKGTNWIDLASREPHIEGAYKIVAQRLHFDVEAFIHRGRWVWQREWMRFDHYQRLDLLRSMISEEIKLAMHRSIELVECAAPVNTIGD